MNSFEIASRSKLRFDISGNSSVEDLWDLSKEVLAEYEAKLQERIEKSGKRTRFAKKKAESARDELRLSLVTYIIDTKVMEEEEDAKSIVKKQEKDKLLSLLAKKQEEKLLGLTEEEIKERLNSL
jgi:hypothetical protein